MRKCLSVLMGVCGILRKCIVPWTTSLQKHAKLLSDLMDKLEKSIFDFGITSLPGATWLGHKVVWVRLLLARFLLPMKKMVL